MVDPECVFVQSPPPPAVHIIASAFRVCFRHQLCCERQPVQLEPRLQSKNMISFGGLCRSGAEQLFFFSFPLNCKCQNHPHPSTLTWKPLEAKKTVSHPAVSALLSLTPTSSLFPSSPTSPVPDLIYTCLSTPWWTSLLSLCSFVGFHFTPRGSLKPWSHPLATLISPRNLL